MQWYYWVVLVILCLLSMFFSAADMVYCTVDKTKLEKAIKKYPKRAKLALHIADDYEFSIATILFCNNVVNIFASSIITIVGISLNPDNQQLGVTIATIVFTIILIIFCEFIPKAFAKRFNFSLSLAFAYPVLVLKYITCIVVWPISKLFHLFGKLFKKKSKEEDVLNEEELTEMVDTLEEGGDIEEDQADIVRGAIDLTDIQAYEIMTPRVDVYSIDVNDNINEIIKDEEIFSYSRVLVYDETIDNVIGILPVKSLARELLKGNKNIDLKSLLAEPLRIPRNHQIMDLLQEFKKRKIHIAVVMDEYGGTEGIVTMEDILEEIVGEIFDETDDIEEIYVEKGDGVYIVDGSLNIDDFFELIGYNEEFETDYSTVSGFCQEILDRFAKEGDEFDFSHYHFEILKAEEFTVERLKVTDLEYNSDND